MKKLILFLVIIMSSILLHAQVEVKGIQLGATHDGEDIVFTSLGGVEGALILSKLNDGRIYLISFKPSEDGVDVSRIYSTEVEKLKNGLEKKYDIKFRKTSKSDYSDDYYLKANKDGVFYLCIVEENEYRDPSMTFSLLVYNDKLFELNKKEEQERADDDF